MNNDLNKKYQPIIGLEVHVELATKSKMFCACSAEYFGHDPNTHVCPVCLGLPGALPVPNQQAIEWCLMLGMALNCEVPPLSKFDRKNYFYPDLPKGYQISQYDLPFCVNGYVILNSAQDLKSKETKMPKQVRHDIGRKIGIRRVHMEEDTAKLVHQLGMLNVKSQMSNENYTLIDFNRSGVPLVEVVTEPNIHSAQEAKLFLQKLQQIIRYLGISDCDMEKGSMRLEPNVSIKKCHPEFISGSNKMPKQACPEEILNQVQNDTFRVRHDNGKLPPYKVEVKNINSFRFVERAIDYEIKRQIELLERGQTPTQETRGFDEVKMRTLPQRGKEEAHDYRYFPEPDIPPLRWDDKDLAKIKAQIPELPDAKLARFVREHGLSEYDATILTTTLPRADYFEEAVHASRAVSSIKYQVSSKAVANWIINKHVDIEKTLPAELIQLLLQKTQAPTIDEEELEKVVKKVLLDNPKAVSDYKSGKVEALMFLVGQVMRVVKGQAESKMIKKLLEENL